MPSVTSENPTTYATCASRNDARPGTNASFGNIRKTSPNSESTSATTNHARMPPDVGSRVSAAAIISASVSGLHT